MASDNRYKRYFQSFLRVITSQNIGNTLKIFCAKGLSLGFLFLSSVLIARNLTPQLFGLFSICLATMNVIGRAVGGGIDAGLIKFYSQFEGDPQKTTYILRSAFLIKLFALTLVLCVGCAVAPFIAEKILGASSYANMVRLALCGSLGVGLFECTMAQFQAKKQFNLFAGMDISANLFKLVLIVLLIGTELLQVSTGLTAYIGSNFVFFGIAMTWAYKDLIAPAPRRRALLFDFLHFSKWMFLTTAFINITRRLDIFILGHFKNTEEVGYYSAAFAVAMPVEVLLYSIIIVFFPIVSEMSRQSEFEKFLKEELALTVPLALFIFIVCLAGGNFLIQRIYSDNYAQAAIIFKILMAGIAFSLVTNPLGLIAISMNNPQIVTIIEAISFLIILVGASLAAPVWGGIGVAAVCTISKLASGVMFYFFAKSGISKLSPVISRRHHG